MKEGKSFDDLKKELGKGVTQLEGMVKYNYNIDFDPRNLIGDNYANQTERNYGCSDVEGPDASHGTNVAGIIAAVRGNRIGMDGIANNVRIMSVRVVPDGDERDKDVANGIRYAVDNGASIINMSFGKSFSFNKKVVDDAVKYALSKDVLLVHAAGNDGKDNDNTDNFPNPRPEGKSSKRATNWVEVGAANWKTGADAAATFSNYGKLNVDLFSPGVDIYSTIPDNKYDFFDGTSMASPACAGVAAILRSYFPELTAPQVRDILMATVTKNTNKIFKPGRGDKKSKVDFTDLCITGGVVNAEKAVALALTTKGKKKVK
jgi:subtilisin family serine protease